MRGAFLPLCLAAGIAFAQSSTPTNKPAPTGKKVHLAGERARTLISLLVSGNNEIQDRIKNGGSSEIVLHDLEVLTESTYKYDPDARFFRLHVVSAWAKLAPADNRIQINEATAIDDFLAPFGLDDDLAMEGSYREVPVVDCKINASVPYEQPARFQCDLVLPSWAKPGK